MADILDLLETGGLQENQIEKEKKEIIRKFEKERNHLKILKEIGRMLKLAKTIQRANVAKFILARKNQKNSPEKTGTFSDPVNGF